MIMALTTEELQKCFIHPESNKTESLGLTVLKYVAQYASPRSHQNLKTPENNGDQTQITLVWLKINQKLALISLPLWTFE